MKALVSESDLKDMLRVLIRENLEGFDFNDPNLTERDKKSSKKNPGKGKKKGDKIKYKDVDKHLKHVDKEKKRKVVLNFFKRKTKRGTPVVKYAPYAYALWPDLEQSNARSQFTKCLWNKPNQDGFPYSFTDPEISRLYGMISSAVPTVNESINEGYAYGGNVTGEDLYLTARNDGDYYNRYIMPLVRSVAKKQNISFDILVKSKVMANMSKLAVDLYQRNFSDEQIAISTPERLEFKKLMSQFILDEAEEMRMQ